MSRGLYFVNSKTNQKIPINDCQRSTNPIDCDPFCNYVKYTESQLPKIADLRRYLPPVENQLTTRSCVANALAGAYEYLLKRGVGDNKEMSRLFIYYNARCKSPMFTGWIQDTGCQISDAMATLQEHGTCDENNWPFNLMAVNTRPQDENYQEARNYTILQPVSVKLDLYKMRACLAQGYPFVFGVALYTSFYASQQNGGWVSMPSPNEAMAAQHGLHAMLAVGYIDEKQVLIVRNSWGPEWGDAGYVYMPYAYLTDPKLAFDAFTIQKFSNFDLGQDHWKDNVSEMQFSEPSAFGASAEDEKDDWSFQELDDDDVAKQNASGDKQDAGDE